MLYKKQKGFTLPELLIASTVSLFLIAGIMKVFLNVKKTYEMQMEIAQMQDNARVALSVLEQEIHTAGYVGCPRFTDSFFTHSFDNSSGVNFSPQTIIKGSENAQTDSDEITIQKTELGAQLVENMTHHKNVSVNNSHGFKKNEVVAISECDYVEIAVINRSVKNSSGQTLQFTKPIAHLFQQDAVVNPVRVKRFLIKATGRTNKKGLPIKALYTRDLMGVDQELVTGISTMKISYLEKLSGNSEFVSASQISQWDHVVAIKVDLLVESDSEIADKPSQYEFHHKSYTSSDRRLHREWSMVMTCGHVQWFNRCVKKELYLYYFFCFYFY